MRIQRVMLLLRNLSRQRQKEDDLSEELQFHLQKEIERNIAVGMAPEDARYAALCSFGGVDQAQEQCRDVRGLRIVEEFFQDLRFGLRMLVRKPGFAAAVVLTLGLGIGANTTIFSVLNPLLFKPLPYPEPDRLVTLGRVTPANTDEGYAQNDLFWSYPIFTAWKEASQSFDAVAAYTYEQETLVVAGQPERQAGEMVTASYFPILGVKAQLGRTFVTDEDLRGSLPVMVIGHRLWQRRFGGDLDVIGKEISINKVLFTVIGVTEPEFRGQFGSSDFWLSMAMAEKFRNAEVLASPGSSWLMAIARLKPGVSLRQARAELPVVAERVSEAVPGYGLLESDNQRVDLIPLQQTKVDPEIARVFTILLGAVGCVLLIACANTANLLQARAVERQKEFAVRLSLGAGRQRILRQVLTESLLLALLGGAAGLLVALWGVHWLTTNKPWNNSGMIVSYPWTFEYFAIHLDWRVLMFNSLLALGTGVVLGCAPAWRASRLQANPMLSQGAVSGFRSRSAWNPCRALVASAIAISLVLLAGAGLLIKSLMQLLAVKPGFDRTTS